jgi:predicted ArsR family transcriptional regulator
MDKMITLKFDNIKQCKIFFLLINKEFGLTRDLIQKFLCIPRTTIYDNITELMRKHYVKSYTKKTSNKGRPTVYFYIRKEIKNLFYKSVIPSIEVNNKKLDILF